MHFSDEVLILRKVAHGENYLRLVCFGRTCGLLSVLGRISAKQMAKGIGLPDLYQTGQLVADRKSSHQPAFFREFHLTESRTGLARSYDAMKAAARLGQFYENNLLHLETFDGPWELLEEALRALEAGALPAAILLKTCYCFARDEGYAVRNQWLEGLPVDLQQVAVDALRTPAAECPFTTETLQPSLRSLERWMQSHTSLIP
jgi:hypothetical protein